MEVSSLACENLQDNYLVWGSGFRVGTVFRPTVPRRSVQDLAFDLGRERNDNSREA